MLVLTVIFGSVLIAGICLWILGHVRVKTNAILR